MSYREALIVARLRQDLRERIMNFSGDENVSGVWDVLARFDRLADLWPELEAEASRWRIRFQLLGFGLAVDTVKDFPAA